MKILIVTDNLKEQVNGVVTTYKNMEDHAIHDGHSIVYFDPRQFRYINCPLYPEIKLSLPSYFIKKIKKMGADRIHIATEGPLGLFAKFYCDAYKIPYTTAYHTKFPEFLKKIAWIPTTITYSYLRWFHKYSKAILVPSQSMKDELILRGFNNLVVWTRGVSQELITKRTTSEKNVPLKVLYVGRVSKEKNLDDLCKLQHIYDITVVGDGPILKNLIRKYRKVYFTGYKFREDLSKIYSENDVFAFPSLTDTFGIVIIEAMCNGLPVAAYRVTGPQDIVDYGVTGYLSMYGNSLQSAIEKCRSLDNIKVQDLSVNKWTWKNCYDIFINTIK